MVCLTQNLMRRLQSACTTLMGLILLSSSCIAASSEAVFPTKRPNPYGSNGTTGREGDYLVPNIVHQIYDYQSPSFFLYLSILCVQRYVHPQRHILWVNDEGRFRKGHWHSWQQRASPNSWEFNLTMLIKHKQLEVKFITFPLTPPGNDSVHAKNHAHRSDFVRMTALNSMGGIYLDTDAFAIQSLDCLRNVHSFMMSFDNIVNEDLHAPKRLNNGVMLSSPKAPFLQLWTKKYARFNPDSFDYDSSVVPYELMTQYPDLIHIEMSRIAPMSFAFQTSRIAEAITCGIYVPPSADGSKSGALWMPEWSSTSGHYSFENTTPNEYMYTEMTKKLVLHLTMSQVRGICMMRKSIGDERDLSVMPSLLGRIFRIAVFGYDNFDYAAVVQSDNKQKKATWKACRDHLGIHSTPDKDDRSRQQYTPLHLKS